jgi:hypothetical protein
MKPSLKNLPIIVALVALAVTTIVQGMWSERWGDHRELHEMAAQMEKIPLKIGEWQGIDIAGPEKSVLKAAGAVEGFSRLYKNAQNETVSVFMICGRLKDMYSHTPEKCYPDAGFDTLTPTSHEQIDCGGNVSEFAAVTFMKADATGNQALRIYYAYGDHGQWAAPERPKWTYAGIWGLYKLYVIVPISSENAGSERNSATEIIRVLVPELNHTLFPHDNGSTTGEAMQTALRETASPDEAGSSVPAKVAR